MTNKPLPKMCAIASTTSSTTTFQCLLLYPLLLLTISPTTIKPVYSLSVAVFGGSGYVGRRVCETLVESDRCDTILSISRSGKPPPYYLTGGRSSSNSSTTNYWWDAVDWRSFDLDSEWSEEMKKVDYDNNDLDLPEIDVMINCIGNVDPSPNWNELWGLGFDDDRLLHENGVIVQRAIELAKRRGAKRFAGTSVSYESAKCLEGPIPGYLDGKRMAESIACETFGEEETVLIGPSLVYGGKRFSTFGSIYRKVVESPLVKGYVKTNDFLRGLSSAPLEDWVEKMVVSSPVEVDVVARVLCAGGLGMIDRDMVGDRRQGFYNTDGKAVTYPNVLFVDGTEEIERVDSLVRRNFEIGEEVNLDLPTAYVNDDVADGLEPPFEGALIGKRPYLYPFPVALFFASVFWAIATEQFVQSSL